MSISIDMMLQNHVVESNRSTLRYLDCINDTSDCTTNKIREEIDIKCNIDTQSMKTEWVLNYPKIFDAADHRQFVNITVPVKYV